MAAIIQGALARVAAALAIVIYVLVAPAFSAAAEPVFYELPVGVHAYHLTAGPAGAVWFTGGQVHNSMAEGGGVIGSVGKTGDVRISNLPKWVRPGRLVTGADGNLWFAATYMNRRGYLVPRIGRFSPEGAYAQFVPANRVGFVNSVTSGPDGAIWFTLVYWVNAHRRDAIGRIDPTGQMKKFPLPSRSGPGAIVAGPDGNLWFTEGGPEGHGIGRITPSGRLTRFPLPDRDEVPTSIVAGSDGNLWFGEGPGAFGGKRAGRVGRITTAGAITSQRVLGGLWTQGLAATPDGTIWFRMRLAYGPTGIGSTTTGGSATAAACLKSTPCEVDADALGVDGDGELWFAMSKYYPHNGGGGTGLMEGFLEESEAGFVGFFPRG
jgi:virginiamycin B lyase